MLTAFLTYKSFVSSSYQGSHVLIRLLHKINCKAHFSMGNSMGILLYHVPQWQHVVLNFHAFLGHL